MVNVPPCEMPIKDGDKLGNLVVQRIPAPSEPHRVRVVKLKPYKGIQVIWSHSCKEQRGSVGKHSQSLLPRQQVEYMGKDILQ